MKTFATAAFLATAIGLTGCSEPRTGAYEATIVLPNGQARMAGIAIFREDEIVADGERVKVGRWEESGNLLTAFSTEGAQMFQIQQTEDGLFEHPIPTGGKLVYRKYDLPTWWAW